MQAKSLCPSTKRAVVPRAPRRGTYVAPAARRGPAPVKGVQFSGEFMQILQQSLEREEHRIAEKVGIPNLYLHENVEDAELSENTGVIIWPAGVRLGQHLVRNRSQELKGAKVLEVGSGTGIVGLTAACLGAHVMLTDTREVLPSIWENVEANKELIEAAGGSATVVELDWNEPDADPDVLEQDYDWIFGSDITYNEGLMPILARLYRQIILTNEHAVIKIAHHHRSKETDKTMRQAFADEGLMLRPVDVRTTGSTEYDDPLHVDEAIAFYRIYFDDNRRFLQNGNGAGAH